MTAGTITEAKTSTPDFKFGTISAGDNYTTTFNFGTTGLIGAVVTSNSDDDAIASVSVSGGSAVIGLIDDAGASVPAATTISYIAWGYR